MIEKQPICDPDYLQFYGACNILFSIAITLKTKGSENLPQWEGRWYGRFWKGWWYKLANTLKAPTNLFNWKLSGSERMIARYDGPENLPQWEGRWYGSFWKRWWYELAWKYLSMCMWAYNTQNDLNDYLIDELLTSCKDRKLFVDRSHRRIENKLKWNFCLLNLIDQKIDYLDIIRPE